MRKSKYILIKWSSILIPILLLALTGCGSGTTGGNGGESGALFDSGAIADGETFSFTFENEATVEYFCQIHAPDMQGVVTVSSDATTSGEVTVVMQDLAFNPSSITITPGTTVIWENQDGVTHDIKSGNPNNGNDPNGPRY